MEAIKKSWLFKMHAIAGLLLGIFILLLSLSGSLLVFHDELDEMQYPVIFNKQAALLTVDSCYSRLQQQYPHAQISHCAIAQKSNSPFIFSIYDSSYKTGMSPMQVFVHPVTGDVIKSRGVNDDLRNNFMSWLSAFHNSFRLHKKGEWLLGFFSLVFLLSIISGIIIYRKNVLAVLLFRASILKKTNIHQIIGTWALLFNLMIGVTGYWMQRYVFKKEFYSSSDYKPVLKPSSPLYFNFDSAYQQLKTTYPFFTGYVIYFAQSKKAKTAIYGSNSGNAFIHSKKFADVIFLDSTGKVSKTAFVNSIAAADRYDIINAQVHFGQFGGWPVKILYSFFGLSGGLLSITGFLLWWRRRKN